ncbi:cystin-1 isoform X1 [Monodelphis domestica]|uniref:cystin-1 isoform X1 n=1 Tax=Monodelphis domestica TaxID=13616 RepID=UPI000443557A|nr:cystin-1 isoform X1 [Monodelphis domestica]
MSESKGWKEGGPATEGESGELESGLTARPSQSNPLPPSLPSWMGCPEHSVETGDSATLSQQCGQGWVMGSGSSRSRRARKQLCSPDRNPGVPGVLELGDGQQGTEARQEEEGRKDGQEEGSRKGAQEDCAVHDSESPPNGEEEPESESQLLDQVLAESEAWDPTFEPQPSRASHSRPQLNPQLGGGPGSQANLSSHGERQVSPVQSSQDIQNNNSFQEGRSWVYPWDLE